MSNSKNQTSIEKIVDFFKEDYNVPAKAFVWAKAVKEWGFFLLWGIFFLLVFLLIIFSRSGPDLETSGYSRDHQNVVSHLPDIIKFMDVTKNSVNKRQEIYTSLRETIDLYKDDRLEQKNIEQKLRTLSHDLNICNSARSTFISRFSKLKNPLENPGIATSYKKIIDVPNSTPTHQASSIPAHSEKKQWDLLCKLCENEVQKTNKELLQILKTQTQ
ncbi:MAG: hypothetical protein BGO67_05050 [Alphaproteobacteria bacterium 41-28]|nr:MAG: hypothetical protein BGO67_05050 [Alphaproteobacteria bacterium 41-28]